MPVTPRIEPRMIYWPASAIRPAGANAIPYTAKPSHMHHSKK
jgi:hypothetical protein